MNAKRKLQNEQIGGVLLEKNNIVSITIPFAKSQSRIILGLTGMLVMACLLTGKIQAQAQLYINTGTTFYIGSNSIVSVQGNVTGNNITPNNNGGRLNLIGSNKQTIDLATAPKIDFNNPAGFDIVNKNLLVGDSIYLSNGMVNNPSVWIGLRNNGKVVGASNARYVTGSFRKIGNQAFTFPVGDSSLYAPVSITAPAVNTDHYTADYWKVNPNGSYPTNSLGSGLNHVSGCEYWMVNRTGGTSNVNVTLSWDARSCGVTNLTTLRVARWDGSQWVDGGNAATTGNNGSGTITSSVQSAFNMFTLGSSNAENPLPVTLVGFTAECKSGGIHIRWTTANEKENHFFELERSIDGIHWSVVTLIPGNGTTDLSSEYDYFDTNVGKDLFFYRLRDVDFSGQDSYSPTISTNCREGSQIQYFVYPNPAQDEITLKVDEPAAVASAQVFSTLGVLVRNLRVEGITTTYPVSDLAPGQYFLRIISEGKPYTLPFIISQ